MIFPKTKLVNFSIITAIILLVGVLIVLNFNSCENQYFYLNENLREYTNLDPETCEELLFKIIEFNQQCNMDIEIIDCG